MTGATVYRGVTVGVPVYNGERFVRRTLEHLQKQDYPEFTVIITDNGSTDGTELICREFVASDHRFRYFRSDINRGVSRNYNWALELADTELFLWNPADDLLAPTFLSKCIEALNGAPRSVIAYSRVQLVDENDTVIGALGDAELYLDGPSPSQRLDTFLRRQAVHLQYGVIETTFLRTLGGEPAIRGADVVLGAKLVMAGPAVQVPEQLFQARRHREQGSMLTRVSDQVRESRPGAKIALGFPQARIAIEVCSAILHAGLPAPERRRCLSALVRGWIVPRRRSYLTDVKQNLLELRRWLAHTIQRIRRGRTWA